MTTRKHDYSGIQHMQDGWASDEDVKKSKYWLQTRHMTCTNGEELTYLT